MDRDLLDFKLSRSSDFCYNCTRFAIPNRYCVLKWGVGLYLSPEPRTSIIHFLYVYSNFVGPHYFRFHFNQRNSIFSIIVFMYLNSPLLSGINGATRSFPLTRRELSTPYDVIIVKDLLVSRYN